MQYLPCVKNSRGNLCWGPGESLGPEWFVQTPGGNSGRNIRSMLMVSLSLEKNRQLSITVSFLSTRRTPNMTLKSHTTTLSKNTKYFCSWNKSYMSSNINMFKFKFYNNILGFNSRVAHLTMKLMQGVLSVK